MGTNMPKAPEKPAEDPRADAWEAAIDYAEDCKAEIATLRVARDEAMARLADMTAMVARLNAQIQMKQGQMLRAFEEQMDEVFGAELMMQHAATTLGMER